MIQMTMTHATIICDNCDARLKVKPGLLKVMKVIKCTKCRHAIKVADALQVDTAEPVVAPAETIEQSVDLAASAETFNTNTHETIEPTPSNDEEVENLKIQLNAARQEISELDERVTSLQQLWQSKEVEVREMAERAQKAEIQAEQALAVRDAFLAKIKQELAVYLVHEREAALSRFSELETKLMGLKPED